MLAQTPKELGGQFRATKIGGNAANLSASALPLSQGRKKQLSMHVPIVRCPVIPPADKGDSAWNEKVVVVTGVVRVAPRFDEFVSWDCFAVTDDESIVAVTDDGLKQFL